MTKVKQNYIVGLDIGTNSCGWVATDKKNNILHLQGKTAIGSHLFTEGGVASKRRGFRTTRRRIKRRKWRLKLLEEIFDSEINKIDPNFFARLRESGLSPLDKQKSAQAIIFRTPAEDKQFYKDYHTIYHLRHALMTEDKRFDLRLVYLAIHHIVKYRGNFLQDTPVKNFDASKLEVAKSLANLNEIFAETNYEYKFAEDNAEQISDILRAQDKYKLNKRKELSPLFVINYAEDKVRNAKAQKIGREIASAILGYKAKFEVILAKDVDNKSDWEFSLAAGDADDKLDAIVIHLDEAEQAAIAEIKKLFSAVTLNTLVDEGCSLSESMVNKYVQHQGDLKLLKKVIHNHPDRQKAQKLQLTYDLYVNNRHGHLLKAKKQLKSGSGALTKDDFYKYVKANLDDSESAKKIYAEMELDKFMPKQRTSNNGTIPFQLHQIELDKIIKMQAKYYPFLAKANPVKEHLKQAPYQLDELVRFRVPYYVGPMITKDLQQKTSGKNFAWMVRQDPNDHSRITPWNFEEKVDCMQSANNFIRRMTTKDTYLLGEDVLPANSLLYQKYEVLNELNNIRVNGNFFDASEREDVFNNLFKKQSVVTKQCLANHLKEKYGLIVTEIKGLSDDKRFNSSLSTYHKFVKTGVFDKELTDPQYREDLEKIIEWNSIFEDKAIFKKKLKEISWLTDEQIKALTKMRFKGWGRLSKKLLTELKNKQGRTIMEQLWLNEPRAGESRIFVEIVNEPSIKKQIVEANQGELDATSIEDVLADAYTSPANKKAIREVIKVVADITKAAGGKAPGQIAIEFAREPGKPGELTKQRGTELRRAYARASEELVDKTLKDSLEEMRKENKLAKDKYYLYFMQGGRDAYTGERINIDEIEKGYQIDHILPQSFIKDDSLNNRVLVATRLNAEKSDDVPIKHFGNKRVAGLGISVTEMWQKWQKAGLITKGKLYNLLTDPGNLKKYQRSGFIKRQLVETSQIIKLVATILQNQYPDAEIIVVKASYNHALRERLNLYKSRDVNDYHHAIDAYLSTVCGNYLYQMFPKMRPFFVYGKFKKFSQDSDVTKEATSKMKRFNFIGKLLQKDHPNKPAPEELCPSGSDKIVFYKHPDIFDKLRKAYNYKYMLVSRSTETKDQEMFGMTIYPRYDRDTSNKPRELVSKAKGLDTAIYGGYSKQISAYMAIVRIDKAKSSEYRVMGVPMTLLAKLKTAKNQSNHDAMLKEALSSEVMSKRGVKDFTIVKGKVPYNQLVIDGNEKYLLTSAHYQCNAKQLTLSSESMRTITKKFTKDDNLDELLMLTFDEILSKIDAYLPLFDKRDFRKKLHLGRDKVFEMSSSDKLATVVKILQGLHNNPQTSDLKNIGIKTPFGMFQATGGIGLSSDAKLVYQSPTGLFENRVKITDL